jgi:hypothetical protein
MTNAERRIDEAIRLQLAGLDAYLRDVIVLDMSMTEDSFFVEVILNDGGKLAQVEEAMISLTASLREEGIRLEALVAAGWTLRTIEYGGICRGESGGIRTAEYFNAELTAGSAHQIVTIEVSHAALSELSERLGLEKTPEGVQRTNAIACEILRDQINEWLSFGGESRWNPAKNNIVRLSCLPVPNETT